jgi:diamine N-acetyltransferase
MEQELIAKLEVAGVPMALKMALEDLTYQVELLRPSMPAPQQRRIRYRLERVITEAADPTADAHWWAVYLDLTAKMASEYGAIGQPVIAASQWLPPLLRSHLGPYDEVTLRPITEDTVWGICQLSETLTEPRKNFVATNAVSLAQAHFNKHAWFRAIYAGKAPVGFVMIVDDAETPEYFLWRFMIGEPYQGRGYGRQAIRRLVEYVRTRPNATELLVSCGEGEGSPKEFYLKQGFVPTGEVMDEETVLRMVLA